MTALIRKNLKAGGITPKLILMFSLVGVVLGIIARRGFSHGMIIGGLSGGFVGSYVLYFYSKTDAVWQKLEANMPITTAKVELSRYIAHAIAFFLGQIAPAVFVLVSYLSGAANAGCNCVNCICEACGCTYLTSVFNASIPWLVVYFVLGAFLFPILRAVSMKYAFIIPQIVAFVIAIAILVLSSLLIGNHHHGQNFVGNMVLFSGAVVLFVISYFVSLWLYRRRLRRKGVLG